MNKTDPQPRSSNSDDEGKPFDTEVQKGEERSIAKDERLKRVIRHHPLRDEPRVDSIEPGPSPEGKPGGR